MCTYGVSCASAASLEAKWSLISHLSIPCKCPCRVVKALGTALAHPPVLCLAMAANSFSFDLRILANTPMSCWQGSWGLHLLVLRRASPWSQTASHPTRFANAHVVLARFVVTELAHPPARCLAMAGKAFSGNLVILANAHAVLARLWGLHSPIRQYAASPLP